MFFVFFPDALEVDFGAEAAADGAEAAAPRYGVGDGVVCVEIVFREAGVYIFVRVTRVDDLVLESSCTYARCDALAYCLALPLYTEDFWPACNAYYFLMAFCTLCKVDQYAKRRGEAMPCIWDGRGVVCDKRT